MGNGFYIEYDDGTREWVEMHGGYSNWSLPSDDCWEVGLARFLQHCRDNHGDSLAHSKVTPAGVECNDDMKLRRYNPRRPCPFCKAPDNQLIEKISWGGYYEHTDSKLWAYIPFIHTLKCCRVCGESFPEELNPELKDKYDE